MRILRPCCRPVQRSQSVTPLPSFLGYLRFAGNLEVPRLHDRHRVANASPTGPNKPMGW